MNVVDVFQPERVETETKSRRTTRGNSRRKTTRRTHLDENEEPINVRYNYDNSILISIMRLYVLYT